MRLLFLSVMSLRHALVPFFALAIAAGAIACDGLLDVDFDDARAREADAAADANADVPGGDPDPDVPLVPASKVDLLLVVDNSASMGDKNNLLADSIGTLLRDLAKVGDMHVGVLSTSLGDFGASSTPQSGVCDATAFPRLNDKAHLRTTDAGGAQVPGTSNGFLTYTGGDVEPLVKNTELLVRGVGETGCGLEAQLEATYRFLSQPDPWVTVTLDKFNQATLGSEIDAQVLAQRKAFLRPDSALVVVMITDEDDSSVDPLSVGGQGWAFMSRMFPGSKVFRGAGAAQGTTAPRGTSICATNPGSASCTSCGFQFLCNPTDPACQAIKNDVNCRTSGSAQTGDGYDGYYGPDDDSLNVRFHRMKERFGIDPQFPIRRYVDGLSASKVPDRAAEHPTTTVSDGRRTIAAYEQTPKCTNPIFAASLPSGPGEELCNLPRGPRSRELVIFALLGGFPESLAGESPNWKALVGANPGAFDYSGLDPHMVPSVSPRAGLAPPSATRGDNGSDPVHGREWDTRKNDLQFACTFPLPATRVCNASDPSCDCAIDGHNPPLCAVTLGQQIRAKAYPTTRPLRVAQGLGERAIIGSICAGGGYDNTMRRLGKRIAPRLATQ